MDTDFKIKASEFWLWFQSISNNLLLNPTRVDLIAQLDHHIKRLGDFDWEIGTKNKGGYYLAISPNLDFEKLRYTKQIIEVSVECEGWLFLPSKPQKEWNGSWEMKNELGKEILINSSNWEYILYKFEDETFDMDILIDRLDGNLDTCYLAIDIALTGYLGEEYFMKSIKNIKILTEIIDDVTSKLTYLKYIKKHINSLV